MLNTILILLILLWLLGMVSSYTLGGFIHLLLVLAVAVVLIRVIQGRSPGLLTPRPAAGVSPGPVAAASGISCEALVREPRPESAPAPPNWWRRPR